MDAPILIERLTVVRGGKSVLTDLDLTVAPGITGLLGPSGCGKTTLMRCLVGVQQVRSGSVRVLGQPAGTPSLRHRVGYVTQSPAVYGDLSVIENLAFFARVLGVPRARVDEVVDVVDLGATATSRVDRLSGGQRSRVSLGAALLGNPDVLVMDEPTVGLDPVLRGQLWHLFARLAAAGATLVVSSHVMDEARRCDQLVLMREGAVLGTGSPAELQGRTGTADIESAFLALVTTGGAR